MGFSDAATPCLWVGNIKAGLQQKDVLQVFSSFGAIRRIKLGSAPPGASATGVAAEVHFASIAQAAAALTALNAIVVPRLSGHQPLAIQCWQPSGAPISHAAAPATPQRPAAAAVKAAPTRAAAAAGPLGPQPVVRPTNLAEAAAAVELPGAEDLQAAFAFFEGCAFLAVPEEERASTAKWAVLQALLARGLRHLGGCSFRQLPVLLTHVGDELLKHRGSNPAVEAEYQSYPAAGRLTSLVKDVQSPGLLQVLTEGKAANTAVVQLHLGRLALAGGAPGGGSGGASGGGGGGGAAPPKPRPAASGAQPQPPPGNQYVTSSVPSRHLLLLGVADRDDVARLAGIARQHGTLQKYLHNPRNCSLTLHFDSKEEAFNMAREVEGQCLPGLSHPSPLQVQYKHLVPASKAGAAGAAGAAAGHPKAPPAKSAAAVQPAVKAGKSKQEVPAPTWQYSAAVPSSSLRVKKLDGAVASRQILAEVGQSCCGSDFSDCTFFPSSGIGYLFFKNEVAAAAAAEVLRGKDLPWKQAEPLIVEFRHPAKARLDGSPSAPTADAKSAGAQSAAAGGGAGAGAEVEDAPPCCACCGASGEGVALSRCSGCRVVHYCGRDCQLKDWPARHATECSQLQQLAAALQAAQPAAGGAQLQLLVAALRSPGGREARMLRSLLGADAFPDSSQAGTDSSSSGDSVSSGTGASGGDAAAEEQPGGEAAGESNGAAAADTDGSSEAATGDGDGEITPAAAESVAESDAAHAGSGSPAEGASAASEAAAAAVAADEPTADAEELSDGPAAGEPAAPAAPAEPAAPAQPGDGSAEGEQLPAQQAAPGSEAAAAGEAAVEDASVEAGSAEEPAAEAADDDAVSQPAETADGTAQQAGAALQAEPAAKEQVVAEAAAAEEQAEEQPAAEPAGGATAEPAGGAAEAAGGAAETAAAAEIGPVAEGQAEAAAAAAEQGEAVAAEEQEAA